MAKVSAIPSSSCFLPFLLLQKLKLTDDRQFFRSAVSRIDDAEDGKYKEHEREQADDAADKVQPPGDGKDDPVKDAVNDAPRNAGDKERQALVSVETGEFRALRRKHRDEHQRAEIGKNAHCLIVGDICLIVLCRGVGGVI